MALFVIYRATRSSTHAPTTLRENVNGESGSIAIEIRFFGPCPRYIVHACCYRVSSFLSKISGEGKYSLLMRCIVPMIFPFPDFSFNRFLITSFECNFLFLNRCNRNLLSFQKVQERFLLSFQVCRLRERKRYTMLNFT